MPDPRIQTISHLEWSFPGGWAALAAVGLGLAAVTVWQLQRESRASGRRACLWFCPLRVCLLAVLLWMLCNPARVETVRRTFPKTIAVYIDDSSSMTIEDQPDPVSDRRWREAIASQPSSQVELDRALLHTQTLQREFQRLAGLADEESTKDDRKAAIERLGRRVETCRELWSSGLVAGGLSEWQNREREALLKMLAEEIAPAVQDLTPLIEEGRAAEAEQRIDHAIDLCDQLLVRCRPLALAADDAGDADARSESPREGPGLTRLERVAPVVAAALRRWSILQREQGFLTKLFDFSERVTPLPDAEWEKILLKNAQYAIDQPIRATRLDELLKRIRDDASRSEFGGAVVISDGRQPDSSAGDPRDLAGQLGVPLYVVPIGLAEIRRDVILHHIEAPRSVLQNDKIVIEGILTGLRCEQTTCQIELTEGTIVHGKRRVTFQEIQEDQRFTFEIPTARIGRRRFQLRASPVPGELTADNNTADVEVEVVDAALRVLVADQRPRWEYRYLINLWDREERVKHDQLIFAPRPAGTGSRESRQFPQTADEWNEYRIVILGDVGPEQLDRASQESLREYVAERGGSLIVIAGTLKMPQAFEGQPLEQLLPVGPQPGFVPDPGGYRLELTPEGRVTDSMLLADDLLATERVWREMSDSLPIYSPSAWHALKPTGQTLVRAVRVNGGDASAALPFLCWQTVGAGRVVYLSSPSTYQLRLRHGDTFHHRFWGQLIRWAVSRNLAPGSKTVTIHADKTGYEHRETAQVMLDLADLKGNAVRGAQPTIEAEAGGRVVAEISLAPDAKVPGRYRGEFAPATPGQYVLRPAGPDVKGLLESEQVTVPVQTRLTFQPALSRELRDTRGDRPLLAQLAERTGGMVLEPTTLADLPQVLSLDSRAEESSERHPLWDRWWCLAVIVGGLTLEWILRKRVGLA
jgi:hypothetical protein